jgi:hypothetical protein
VIGLRSSSVGAFDAKRFATCALSSAIALVTMPLHAEEPEPACTVECLELLGEARRIAASLGASIEHSSPYGTQRLDRWYPPCERVATEGPPCTHDQLTDMRQRSVPLFTAAANQCPRCTAVAVWGSFLRYWFGDFPGAKVDGLRGLGTATRSLAWWEIYMLTLALDADQKREHLRRAIASTGGFPMILHDELLSSYILQGDLAGYKRELEALRSQTKGVPSSWIEERMGRALEATGEHDAAERLYREMGSAELLIRLRIRRGDLPGARTALDAASASSTNLDPHRLIVASFSSGALTPKEDSTLKSYVDSLDEKVPYHQFALGVGLIRRGRLEEGLAWLRAFVASSEEQQPRGRAFELRWELERAKAIISKSGALR